MRYRKIHTNSLNTTIADGVRNEKNEMFLYLYDSFFPEIEKYILRNGGDEADAKDIFQDVMKNIYEKIIEDKFVINKSFQAYVFTACKNNWNKNIVKRKIHARALAEINVVEDKEFDYFINDNKRVRDELYSVHFEKLPEVGRRVMKLYFDNKSFKEIANLLKQKNIKSIINKKYKCIKQLKNSIQNDPIYLEIKEDI